LRQFIAIFLESGDYSSIKRSDAEGDSKIGISIKKPGQPIAHMIFRQEPGELYIEAFGEGDKVHDLNDDEMTDIGSALRTRLYHIFLEKRGLTLIGPDIPR
jgi:hypothetical protein